MKRKFELLVLLGFVIIGSLTVYQLMNKTKVAFYDYNEVYNNCKIKKDLERDLELIVGNRKRELDSLQLEISMLSEKIKTEKVSDEELRNFEDSKNRFLTFQSTYEQENIRLKEQYFAQIRNEINDKSIAFAKDNGYSMLFAAIGDGSLMYGDESLNVTEDFQKYLDEK